MRRFSPTSPGVRFKTVSSFSEVTRKSPEKKLTKALERAFGRDASGHITSRFRGGGHKRLYRIIDFKRNKFDIPAKVVSVEYDPNRSVNIALVAYADGEKRYILAPEGLVIGQKVISSHTSVDIIPGNSMPLSHIPVGTNIHNVELKPGAGGKLARGAGSFVQLVSREGDYVSLKLPSGEVRRVLSSCRATIGSAGNREHENITIGKAGRSRWLNRRGHVRGTVMNPVDHPHGGGHGRDHGGRHPVSPTGKPTKGFKTRNNKRTDSFIVKRRNTK